MSSISAPQYATVDASDVNGGGSSGDVSPGMSPVGGAEKIDHWLGLVMATLILIVQFSVFGISNSYASYADEMKKDASLGHPSSSDVSVPNAVMNGIAPFISIFAGALTDVVGPRPVLGAATLCMAIGSFLGSFATNTATLVVLYGIPCGFGMASLSSPSAVALTSWLKERLPLGVGIAYAGSGVGSSVVVAVAGVLAGSSLGWRVSFRLLSIFAIFGFVASLFIRTRKGHIHKPKININGKWGQLLWFLRKLFTSKVFIWMFIAAAFFSFAMFSVFYIVVPFATKFGSIEHLTPYVSYTAISVSSASTLFTYHGIARGATSVFGGALAAKTDPTYVYAMGASVCAISCMMWGLATEYWHLAIVCALLGASIACIFASFPAMAARCFAGPHCGLAVGITMCGYSVGGFAGPPVVLAITSGNNNNFTDAFIVMAWCCIVAACIVLFILRGEIKQQPFATEDGLAEADANNFVSPTCIKTTGGSGDGDEQSGDARAYPDVDEKLEK